MAAPRPIMKKAEGVTGRGGTCDGKLPPRTSLRRDANGCHTNCSKGIARRTYAFERVLGPSDVGAWHHLAYIHSLGTSSYYYDGQVVAQSTTDPAPAAPTAGFSLGGQPSGGSMLVMDPGAVPPRAPRSASFPPHDSCR